MARRRLLRAIVTALADQKPTIDIALLVVGSDASRARTCLTAPRRSSENTPMNGRTIGLAMCAFVALTGACKKDEPSGATTGALASASPVVSVVITPPGASAAALGTGALDKFFPKDGEDGFKRMFTANKDGLAEARLQKDGKDVAVLSIVDAEKLAYAKAKFADATEKLEGFPVLKGAGEQSSVLVKDRFLVKVSSASLDHEARKAILAKFDLKGLGS